MNVLVVKFIVKRPVLNCVPKKWRSYTYAKIFIDHELKGEWCVRQFGNGTFKNFIEMAKKKYGFNEYRYEHWGYENRNY